MTKDKTLEGKMSKGKSAGPDNGYFWIFTASSGKVSHTGIILGYQVIHEF